MTQEFWRSGTGAVPTGTPEAAFLREFTTIPNNTMAIAKIYSFTNVEKENKYTGEFDKYLNINWRILEGEFKNREVSQKIRCFSGTPESIDRNLNMLRLVMTLCQFNPTHQNAPTDDDLKKMIGKTLGIKIREWSMKKADNSGISEGNFVSEVHHAHGFVCETGIKMTSPEYKSPVDSAFSRNGKLSSAEAADLFNDDVSF